MLPPHVTALWTGNAADIGCCAARKACRRSRPRKSKKITIDLGGHVMKIDRRKFLHVAAGAVAVPTLSRHAVAQAYPSRPVQLVIMYPAGSAPDIIGRLTAQWLSERLGQPFVVESKLGAG